MKHWVWLMAAAMVLGAAVWIINSRQAHNSAGFQRISVTRATVIRKATAVGRIEVKHEVPVNSLHGGILTKLLVKPGQKVETGSPLAEVKPIATEQTLLAAERTFQEASKNEENAREYLEGKHLAAQFTRLMLGGKNIERMYDGAALGREQAKENLDLLRQGTIVVSNRLVDFIVRAPVAGHVLEIKQREGSPVTPASTYGFGTVFMTLADMSTLLFRGTVDEIDTGRLSEGMTAHLKIGALPGTSLTGKVAEIALKGSEKNNAMVFDVLINLEIPPQMILRSGYSAVAEIEVDRRVAVLTLPERLVEFRAGKAWVLVPDSHGRSSPKEIITGLSDGFTVEILSGLAEGEAVLER